MIDQEISGIIALIAITHGERNAVKFTFSQRMCEFVIR